MVHVRGCLLVLSFAGLLGAAPADDLAARAREEATGGDEQWKSFVLSADEQTDEALEELTERYDAAIELYQQAEEAGAEGVGGALLLLARRTAQLRATLFWRDQKRKREAATANAPETPAPETSPETPPDGGPERAPEGTPEAAPGAAPETPPEATARTPAAAPEILETRAQRARSIQRARNFIMNHYFRHRKVENLLTRCASCNGRGKKPAPYLDKHRRHPLLKCTACAGRGGHLDKDAARRGFWLCWSPLVRDSAEERKKFDDQVARWAEDPSLAPTLKRVRIKDLEYHGLWVEVTWEERGKEGKRNRTERLLRLGKQWCFYHPDFDRGFFQFDDE